MATHYNGTQSTKNENVNIALNIFDKDETNIPDIFQYVDFHMIFDIKIGGNFIIKSRMVAGGHRNVIPTALTYLSVFSRYSIGIIITIAALNNLNIIM